MNSLALRRVVWKEYRQLRALWLSVIGLTVLIEGMVLLSAMMQGNPIPVERLYAVALGMPMLYALGSGAMMFAGENESSTYEFLRGLPVWATLWHLGKLAVAVLSALVLMPICWLTAWAICSGHTPVAGEHADLWLGGIVTMLELLVWATLFSLLLRRALWAAVMAGVAWLTVIFVASFDQIYEGKLEYLRFTFSLPWRGVAMAVVVPLTFALSRRWLREFPWFWDRPRERKTYDSSEPFSRRARTWGWPSMLGRLVWQQWRRSYLVIAAVITGFSALACWFAWNEEARFEPEFLLALTPFLAVVFGLGTFQSDQRNCQFRFFAERGVGPRMVWMSRMIAWATPLVCGPLVIGAFLACSLMVFTVDRLQDFARVSSSPELLLLGLGSLGFAVLCFAIGQACSLLIRSTILALLATVVCCGVALTWMVLVVALKLPFAIALVPIPPVLLLATWLHAPGWMLEKIDWRSRLRVAASLLVPMVLILVSLVFYRNHEIPRVVLPFDPAEVERNATPQEEQTAQLYLQSLRQYESHTFEKDKNKADKKQKESPWIATFIKASERQKCWFAEYSSASNLDAIANLKVVSRAVLGDAQRLENEGNLEEALQHYMALLRYAQHLYQQPMPRLQQQGVRLERTVLESLPLWAVTEGQTAESIRRAIALLQAELDKGEPQWKLAIAGEYVRVRKLMLASEGEWRFRSRWQRWFVKSSMLLEKERLLRFLDVYAVREFQLANLAVMLSHATEGVPMSYTDLWNQGASVNLKDRPAADFDPVEVPRRQINDWLQSTPVLNVAYGMYLDDRYLQSENNLLRLRRVVVQQLALIAWREQHGELPQSLEQLVGNGLETLPLDPYTRQVFLYQAEGADILESDIEVYHELLIDGGASQLATKVYEQPFLWSPGFRLRYAPQKTTSGHSRSTPNFLDFKRRDARVQSEAELWWFGQVFPIPDRETKEQPQAEES